MSPCSDSTGHVASPRRVQELLHALQIQPRKQLGQHFLVDGNIRDHILGAAALTRRDTVLEIGPGLGVLTERMAPAVHRLVAVEKDPALATYLADVLAPYGAVKIVCADALACDLAAESGAPHGHWVVVSNLPYSAGTRILVELMLGRTLPDRMVLMLQRETAERVEAKPHSAHYGPIAILATLCYAVEHVRDVGPNCFLPKPDVVSRVIRMDVKSDAPEAAARTGVLAVVKRAFATRRKKLGTWLKSAAADAAALATLRDHCAAAGIDTDLRPENIPPSQWLALARAIAAGPDPLGPP